MKWTAKILVTALMLSLMAVTAYAAEKNTSNEILTRQDAALMTIDATVESIDRTTREVTLKNEEGETVSFKLDEDAGRIDDIDVGDEVSIGYLEAVTIQVFEAGQVEPGAVGEAVVAETAKGKKPAGLAVGQVSVVVTIEAIDLEKELVTLKNKDGELETVRPEHPENLKKVKVGDKVKITYTKAIGFSVTEKPVQKKD